MILLKLLTIILLLNINLCTSASIKDILTNKNSDVNSENNVRVPRESKYYQNRYTGSSSNNEGTRSLKPEESEDSKFSTHTANPLEKRCTRCENNYLDPYSRDSTYSRPLDPYYRDSTYNRPSYYDRSRNYDGYDDRDRYYDRYDRYYDRDSRDRYYRPYDRYYDGTYERERYDRYDTRYEPRYDSRGVGYDNRGYDYSRYDGYRPYDDTYRGSSTFDATGRGYYFAGGRPDYGYGGLNDYRSRGYGYGGYRYKDPYDSEYRYRSYLLGRNSSSTDTPTKINNEDNFNSSNSNSVSSSSSVDNTNNNNNSS